MIRRIIEIDRKKCNGCGLCASACHEGAIGIVNGAAELLREDHCDGLGDCLPACPMNAITFVEREAPAYDEAAVNATKAQKEKRASQDAAAEGVVIGCKGRSDPDCAPTRLNNFPIQIKLAPVKASWYDHANLLIAADCTAYACGDFHDRFMCGKVTLIGCPKLDAVSYAEKLAQILTENPIEQITLARMTVPCCGGLTVAVKKALEISGKNIPLRVVTISPDGKILE
ncbi:MAG: 4Fe-4S binding protein [Oscillospiraceae bacterium]|nr:4Fe-4S binding protein [Oscillospiraceae bacterium]